MRIQRIASKAAVYGMLIALAFIFSYIEAILPLPMPVPGVKLGLANLVTIVGFNTVGVAGAAAVDLLRIVLAGFTFGNMFSMMYSLAGGVVSLLLMAFVRKMGWFDQMGVSIIGGVGHNIGQLAVAAWVTQTAGVFFYLPVLMVAGCVSGALIGLLGGLVTARIRKAADRFERGEGSRSGKRRTGSNGVRVSDQESGGSVRAE